MINMVRPIPPPATSGFTRLRGLVHEATLAASSHNTQPWKFKLGKRSIGIFPDLTRRCPVVDPDDHHLFVSLGCATENLVCGALANGLYAHVAGRADRVDVAFEDTLPVRSTLYDALPQRQCSRSTYDGQQISAADLELLERAAAGSGVHPVVLTDRSDLETVAECVALGTAAQIHNTAFVKELGTWIRFNEAEAARTGDGLSTAATGAPSGPRWLRRMLLHGALTLRSENARNARHLRSSAGVIIFFSDRNDPEHWIEVGRCVRALRAPGDRARHPQCVHESGGRDRAAADADGHVAERGRSAPGSRRALRTRPRDATLAAPAARAGDL